MTRPSLFDRLRARLADSDPPLNATNGPCLVLGSAPQPILPAGFGDHWTLITVNASQAGAAAAGIARDPDITVMSGQMLGAKPENRAGQEALRDAATSQLLLIERGVEAKHAIQLLDSLRYRYGTLRTMNHWQRAGLTYRLLGEHLAIGAGEAKISTGLFAVVLAASLGSGPIVMSGFSLSSDGHSYNALKHHRQHRLVDARALRLLSRGQHAIYSADAGFAAASGLPLWEVAPAPSARTASTRPASMSTLHPQLQSFQP